MTLPSYPGLRSLGPSLLTFALALGLATTPAARAQGDPPEAGSDGFKKLGAALAAKRQILLVEMEEARNLARSYEEFLADPETLNDDRTDLRHSLVQERDRHQRLQAEALEIQSAIRQLRHVPWNDSLDLAKLRDAYEGLDELGERGRAAWGQLLTAREVSVETLQENYAADLAAAQAACDGLETVSKANRLLLDAIDSRRLESSAAEFRGSLKLPRVMSAVTLGFGLRNPEGDRDLEAQLTLVALIGYAQFFWDHHSGARSHLAENEFPRDHARNIFGVPDGEVVTSDAIAGNQSDIYYLSSRAKENFNGRINAIWGPRGTLAVHSWNQKYARTFHQACVGLSTPTESGLRPNEYALDLLDAIDALIDAHLQATRTIAAVHSDYTQRIADAKRFDEKSALSSAHYNAEIWARESEHTIAAFEAARRILSAQVEACTQNDWTPNAKGITASVATLRRAHSRVLSVHKVKHELTALLQ